MSQTDEIQKRRTFAIISHPDAGKTTLTEKLLYHGGAIHQTGEVKGKAGSKAATSDWMAMEQQRGISITSSVMQFDYADLRVNLLDTPGHKDFGEDTYRTLMAADSACMLIDVAKGVEERTRKLYEVCRYRQVPIFTFVNKLDREGKAPLDLIDEVESTLNMTCYPVTWPLGIGGLFRGIYNRFSKEIILYDQKRENVEEFKVLPLESFDDPMVGGLFEPEIFEQVREEIDLLNGVLPPFDVDEFLDGKMSPVTFGSAKQNFGVDIFLDFFTRFAPGPAARKIQSGDDLSPIDDRFSAFVFKMQANMDRKHRDRIAFLRVCSGTFERGMKVQHQRLRREIRLSYSSQFMAQERDTVDVAYAGDIIGLNDSGHFRVGDTVSVGKGIVFEPIPKFAPELFARLTVLDAMKRKKLHKALDEIAEEGAIQIFLDPIIGAQDPIVGVVGELQFEVLLYRLSDEYNLEAKIHRLSFSVARWPRNQEGKPVQDELKGNFTIYKDCDDNPVILLDQEWDLNWAKRENPEIEFCTSITPQR